MRAETPDQPQADDTAAGLAAPKMGTRTTEPALAGAVSSGLAPPGPACETARESEGQAAWQSSRFDS